MEVVEAAEADSGLNFLLTLVGVLIVLALGLLEADEAGLEDFLLVEVSTSEYFSGAYFLISDSFRAPAEEVARALRVLLTRSLCLCSEKKLFWKSSLFNSGILAICLVNKVYTTHIIIY